MTTAFIFHGTAGFPEENWFPWLKKELEALKIKVFVPQFPTPENQTLDNWFKVFKEYEKYYTKGTILIGHSLGGVFLLRVLEKYNIRVRAAYLIAAPIGVLPIKNYESDKLFLSKPFNWKKIKGNSPIFRVYQSDNDPYVCRGNGKELAKFLKTEMTFIPNAGHFNAKAGYLKFDALRERIKSDLEKPVQTKP